MRIVHVNADRGGLGGAENAISLMMQQQRAEGQEVLLLCRDNIAIGYKCLHLMARLGMKIALGHCYSGGIMPTGLAKKINALKPDMVYLHRLQLGTIGMRELAKIEAPLIAVMHDLWLVNGVCPYWQEELFELPMTSRMRWIDRLTRRGKRRVFQRLIGNGHLKQVLVASDWAKMVVESSEAFVGAQVVLRPLPVDPVYKKVSAPIGKSGDFVILFGAAGNVFSKAKGFDRLAQAIDMLPDAMKRKTTLQIFGVDHGPNAICDMPIKYLGALTQEELAQAYSMANVLAFPSRQETYGLIKHEALKCGCPVVAFSETACPEGIEHGLNGWIASSVSEFADGIVEFFNRWQKQG